MAPVAVLAVSAARHLGWRANRNVSIANLQKLLGKAKYLELLLPIGFPSVKLLKPTV